MGSSKKVLLIINSLRYFNEDSRKHGLYPTLIKMHSNEGINFSVLNLENKILKEEELSAISKAIGGKKILSKRKSRFLLDILTYGISRLLYRLESYPAKLWSYYLNYFWLLNLLRKHFKQYGKPEIISALASCEISGIVAFMIWKKFNIPYTVLEHRTDFDRDTFFGSRKKIINDVLVSASIVLPVSSHLKNTLNNFTGNRLRNIQVMPNPVSSDFFISPEELDQQVIDFSNKRYIFAGWTNWRTFKRIDVALKAFLDLSRINNDVCLVLAGPVPDWALSFILQETLQDKVLLRGSLDRKGIHKLAFTCNCGIISSDFETFGLPAVEALAAGKPVVTTKCGGPETVIVNDHLGRTVGKGSPQMFMEAMQSVYNKQDLFDPHEIQDYCKNNFSENVLSKKWLDIYNN